MGGGRDRGKLLEGARCTHTCYGNVKQFLAALGRCRLVVVVVVVVVEVVVVVVVVVVG